MYSQYSTDINDLPSMWHIVKNTKENININSITFYLFIL